MSYVHAAPLVRPQIDLIPASKRTDGDDAVDLAGAFGLVLDDWQHYGLSGALGRTAGRWSAREVGLEVPRQNGKTVILQVRCLWGLWGTPERLITWTAHEYKTAREAFLDLRSLIENSPFMSDVKSFRTFPQLEIEMRDGSRAIFLARTGASGRGFSGDCVILDEAYELNSEQMAALMPTLSARPDPQLWYASMSGMETSLHLMSVRDRALAADRRLCYLAWAAAAPGVEGVDLDDRDGWQRANPGAPHRISWEAIEQERGALTTEAFARERLGLWSGSGTEPVIDPDRWAALEDLKSRPGDPVAFGVEVPPDRSTVWISVSGTRLDKRKHTELVACCAFHAEQGGRCAGTAWCYARLAELDRKWKPNGIFLDPSGPAGALIVGLTKADVELELVGAREMAQASGEYYDLVIAEGLRHLGQPELNSAVGGARKRPLAGAWTWQPADASVNIAPLRASTLAVHGVDRPTKRRRKTGRAMAV